jgi:hypothetical protein
MRLLIKIAVAAALLAGFFVLFLRTARDVRSEPYVVGRETLASWTLALETPARSTSPILVVRPPQAFGSTLFSQVFQRMMESLKGTTSSSVPLVLRDEYELALASRYTPEALLDAARSAGVESGALSPVCLAMRRDSQPGLTRTVYFVIFDAPSVEAFRRQLADEIAGTPTAAIFAADALSPVLIVGSSDEALDAWLPLRADRAADCVAPISVN